jgi:hypothetical protein
LYFVKSRAIIKAHFEKKQNQRNLVTQSQGSKIVSKNDDQDCQAAEKSKTSESWRHKAQALKLSKG